MSTSGPLARFGETRKPLSWPLLLAIGVLHVAVFYGLARALAPDLTAEVERTVVAAFQLDPPPPPPAPAPEPDAADEGAAGDPGREAVARPVAAPSPKQVLREEAPAPRTASTGTANFSGAADAGEGTGAAGSGDGTGSGNAGSGRGSGMATKPEHISGAINNARDYPIPPGGRDARRGTEVIVRVIVGVDGRARDCRIYRPSPDPEADRLTCELVEKRLGFRPARDLAGNPVAAPFFWRQRWF
jgi:protein TonB